jgi:uncharacterized membrane protein
MSRAPEGSKKTGPSGRSINRGHPALERARGLRPIAQDETFLEAAATMAAMTAPTRSEAQQRADEIRVFRAELARLEGEDVLRLQDAQRAAIERHHEALLARLARDHDIDRDVHAKRLSLGMRIASFLGAVALAASVFFLFRQFWGYFPVAAQVAILAAAALGSFALTCFAGAREGAGYFTKLAAMVAFACFVLDIAMLGQIFDITPSDKALLAWAAFAFLLAYAFDLRLLLAAGILCVIAFVSARTGTFGGVYWLDFGERPEDFFPAAAVVFAVPAVIDHRRFAGFAPIYRVFGLLSVFLPVLVLANWGQASYIPLDGGIVKGIYQVAGFALAGGAAWLGMRRGWSEVVNTGVAFFVIFLYTKLFDWWWDWMPKSLFFFVLALVAILLLMVLRRLRRAA